MIFGMLVDTLLQPLDCCLGTVAGKLNQESQERKASCCTLQGHAAELLTSNPDPLKPTSTAASTC